MDFSGSIPFYNDNEVYQAANPGGEPDFTEYFELPTSENGSFAASLTYGVEPDLSYFPTSFSMAQSYTNPILSPIQMEAPYIPQVTKDAIPSPEVNLFWERYREYPAYLKKIKKRNRKKAKKTRLMTET